MDINKFSRMDIALMGRAEMQAFENIIYLAIGRLQVSPVTNLLGSPLQSQAGLKGTDLISVKNMLEKFVIEFGFEDQPMEPKPYSGNMTASEISAAQELLR